MSASALIGLVIGFGWPLLLSIPGISSHRITDVHDDLVNIAAKWLVVAVLAVIAFAVLRRRPADLGIRGLGWRDGLAAIAGMLFALAASGVASRLVAMPSTLTDLHRMAEIPLGVRVAVVATAAVCEEFIYRGFAIEELATLTGNRWVAGLLSLILFTISHAGLYGVSTALVVPAIVGGVLTVLYLRRRNLPSCVLLHGLMDGLFLLVVPAMTRSR